MGNIFISYRRSDTEGYAGRLWDRIAAKFGFENVFMDVDSIAPGDGFPQVLAKALESSDVIIAIIGRDWMGLTPEGKRRIDDTTDFVRLEVASAIRQGIPVIPVLVANSTIPKETDLPPDLSPLSSFNAIEIRHARFNDDVNSLIAGLEKAMQNAKERHRVTVKKGPLFTPIYGITPGHSTRSDVSDLIKQNKLSAFGKLKKADHRRWQFQFAEVLVIHDKDDYTSSKFDVIRSVEYWGDDPLPLGFSTKVDLAIAKQIAEKNFVWLNTQDFRGLVFSDRKSGPILLEISYYANRPNPLSYKVFGPI